MKLSTSLLQAITLGVSVTTVVATTTSCEKKEVKPKTERANSETSQNPDDNSLENCIACGMG